MKPFTRTILLTTSLLFTLAGLPAQADQQQKPRQVWLRTKAGPILNGDLVKMDSTSIDFTVKGILQSVPCDDLIGVMFIPPTPRPTPALTPIPTPIPLEEPTIYSMSIGLMPMILYREKAFYPPKAKAEKIEGTVVLQVVFHQSGRIMDIRLIRGLPYGLSEQAIEAANKVRFIPAMKDGKPVSVRGNLEYAFNLY